MSGHESMSMGLFAHIVVYQPRYSYSYSWSYTSVWVCSVEIVPRSIPRSDILGIFDAIWCKRRNATLCMSRGEVVLSEVGLMGGKLADSSEDRKV
jgi:hypothetical protein